MVDHLRLKTEQGAAKTKSNIKCVRIKKDRLKIVLGLDIDMDRVEGLMSNALVG
jgi:hypothetical protein